MTQACHAESCEWGSLDRMQIRAFNACLGWGAALWETVKFGNDTHRPGDSAGSRLKRSVREELNH